MDEIACKTAKGSVVLRADSLPFSEIPGQSKLFTTYQSDPLSLKKYYPSAVVSHTEIAARIPEVLERHVADRSLLCDALDEMNRKFEASEETLKNISLLRGSETVAVVTGQQAGLFTGPLYTIYKALTAIKMTECLRDRGFKAVPIFWAATEDHDFEEVSKAFVLNQSGELTEFTNHPERSYESQPVGYVKLDETIRETVRQLINDLPAAEYTSYVRSLIEDNWRPETYFGDAFARLMTRLFGKYGLIILCPLDKRLKQLAAPVYVDAIRKSAEIVEALRKRSDELVADDFHAQVTIDENYFPLFWQADDNTRNSIKKGKDGTFQTKDHSTEFTLEELAEIAEKEPTRFSPSVVLRSVVQDYLLPTVCYFGGAAEIAYFAQSGEVYRILDRPPTPILHRQSFTLLEPKQQRILAKYGLSLKDLFPGSDELLPRIVEQHLNRESAKTFADVEEKINTQLNRLDQELSQLDVTLAENLAKRRRKIIYHIGALRRKFHRAQLRKDDVINRQIREMFAALLPNKHLQERTLNITYFLDRYGEFVIDWIYSSVDLSDKGHRVLYL